MEGFRCHRPATGCDTTGLVPPVAVYPTGDDCSVTGGYVYRGRAIAEIAGTYVFGDYCSGRIWGLDPADGGTWSRRLLLDSDALIASFGEDEAGEVYVVDYGGAIYRLASP